MRTVEVFGDGADDNFVKLLGLRDGIGLGIEESFAEGGDFFIEAGGGDGEFAGELHGGRD